MNSYDNANAQALNDEESSGKALNRDQKRAIAAAFTGTAALGEAVWGLSQYDTDDTKGGELLTDVPPYSDTTSVAYPTRALPTPPLWQPASPPAPPEPTVPQEPQLATHPYHDMSFNEAIAEARHEMRPGHYFEWYGSYYKTFYKEEWNQISSEQHVSFVASLNLLGYDHYQLNEALTQTHNTDIARSPL